VNIVAPRENASARDLVSLGFIVGIQICCEGSDAAQTGQPQMNHSFGGYEEMPTAQFGTWYLELGTLSYPHVSSLH
jgi:hypothetical protein